MLDTNPLVEVVWDEVVPLKINHPLKLFGIKLSNLNEIK